MGILAVFFEARRTLELRRKPLVGLVGADESLALGSSAVLRCKLLGHEAQKFIRCRRRIVRIVEVKEEIAIAEGNKHVRCGVLENLLLHILCGILAVVGGNGCEEGISLKPCAILHADAEKSARALFQIHHCSVFLHKLLLGLVKVAFHLRRYEADLRAASFDLKREFVRGKDVGVLVEAGEGIAVIGHRRGGQGFHARTDFSNKRLGRLGFFCIGCRRRCWQRHSGGLPRKRRVRRKDRLIFDEAARKRKSLRVRGTLQEAHKDVALLVRLVLDGALNHRLPFNSLLAVKNESATAKGARIRRLGATLAIVRRLEISRKNNNLVLTTPIATTEIDVCLAGQEARAISQGRNGFGTSRDRGCCAAERILNPDETACLNVVFVDILHSLKLCVADDGRLLERISSAHRRIFLERGVVLRICKKTSVVELEALEEVGARRLRLEILCLQNVFIFS